MHYARDAFEGLSLMDRVMAAKRGAARRWSTLTARPAGRAARPAGAAAAMVTEALPELTTRRSAPTWPPTSRCPTAPFFGTRVVKGIPLADYASLLDERATVPRPVGPARRPGRHGPSYEELVETEGRPRLRYWLDRLVADQVLEAAVVAMPLHEQRSGSR